MTAHIFQSLLKNLGIQEENYDAPPDPAAAG